MGGATTILHRHRIMAEQDLNETRNRMSATHGGALLELATLLNSSLDVDRILGNILLSAMGRFLISRAVVIVRSTDGDYRIRSIKGLPAALRNRPLVLKRHWTSFRPLEEILGAGDVEKDDWIRLCEEQAIDVLLPMILNDEMVGIIGLGKTSSGRPYTDEDIAFLESAANIAATAVQNALIVEQLQRTNRALDSRVQEMNTLFEFSREINATFDEQKIIRLLAYALMGQLGVLHYVISIRNGDRMEPVLHKVPAFRRDKRYQRQLCTLAAPIRINPDSPTPGLETWLVKQGVTTVIPMRSQNETRGVFCLGAKFDGSRIEQDELEYLTALANVSISALENSRLVKEIVEKQRLEKELNIAREIQLGLFPESISAPEGFDIAAVNISSQQIGGDYYDVVSLTPESCVIAIADVAGKGIPASLLMANVQATLRILLPLGLELGDTTARINTIIAGNTSPDKYITFFWGVLDANGRTFRYVNAGHNPPILMRKDGVCERLDRGGLILGVFAQTSPYDVGEVHLGQGDVLLLFTDGVTEAMNGRHEEYGEAALIDVLKKNARKPASEMIAAVNTSINRFIADAPQSDDITMVVVRSL